jgi:hypothetical protein
MSLPIPSTRRGRAITVAALLIPIFLLAVFVTSPATEAATKRKKAATSLSLVFLGNERTIAAGSAGVFSFNVVPNGTLRNPITFDIPDLPSGTTATVAAVGGTNYTLNVATTAASAGGTAVYALRARSGTISRTATFRLTVAAAPCVVPATTIPTTIAPVGAGDFSISSTNATVNATPAQTSSLTVNVVRNNGFTGAVTFKADGIPANVTASFAPSPTTTGTTLYLTPGAAALSGTYLMVISASAGATTRSIAQALVITRTGAFAFSMSPNAISTPQGMAASTTINVGPAGNETIAPDVKFTVTGNPTGISLLTPITTGTSTKLTFLTSAALSPGVYPLVVKGTSGTFTQGLPLTLTVRSNVPGFGLSASPTTQTVARGSVATYAVTAARTNSFAAAITFGLTGLPATATAAFESTATGVLLKITTLAAMAPTTYPLQVTGTSGALVSSVSISLTVTSPAV